MKRVLMVLLLLVVALVGGGLYWLRGNLDGLVKQAIVRVGSEIAQVPVGVDAVAIQPADGAGRIGGLRVGNPAGFKAPYLLKVDALELALDLASVAQDVVHIRKIAVLAPDVIYEKGEGQTNLEALQQNIANQIGSRRAEPRHPEGGGKKLIVDELTVRGARAQVAAAFMGGKTVTVNLPDIVLRDIGKAKGGVMPAELGQELARALNQRLAATVSFDRVTSAMGEGLGKAGGAIKGLFK